MSAVAPLLATKTKSGIGHVSGEGFGEKDIGLLGGLSLLWNNVRSASSSATAVILAGVPPHAAHRMREREREREREIHAVCCAPPTLTAYGYVDHRSGDGGVG